MTIAKHPNVVLIIADDITPAYHGCYGGRTPTPHIDALAREGVRFDRGYSNASLCCPSRWCLFTGQFAGRSEACYGPVPVDEPYLVSQNGELSPSTPTLAKQLNAAGYFTGHVGKWHSRFDCGFLGEDEPVVPCGDPDDPAVDRLFRERHAVARRVVKACGGFHYVDRVYWGNIPRNVHPAVQHHNIGWFTDGALAFLDLAAGNGKPFYLHLANSLPHDPNPLLSLNADHRYTWSGKLEQHPCSHPSDDSVTERMNQAGLQTSGPIAGVNAGVVQIDDQVGIIREKLRAIGELENTIFIYTADHGIPGKGSCHMIGQHLPFVISWPARLPCEQVVQQIFSWVDVVPTLCAACGVSMPDTHRIDGYNVLHSLTDHQPWPRSVAYHEMGWSRSVIKGNYHYIATRYPRYAIEKMRTEHNSKTLGVGLMFDTLNAPFIPGYFDPDQLYDIAADPYERTNLVNDPAMGAIIADLKAELRKLLSTLPRPFPEEPDDFLRTDVYRELLTERKNEMAGLVHYPRNADVPRVWHANLVDPACPS